MTISDSTLVNGDVQPAHSYTVNNLNQYTQVDGASITYDANGNLTSDGVWTYRYDEENQLREAVNGATTVDYQYDANGRRRSKSINGTTTYYVSDNENELAELSSSGVRKRLYVNGTSPDMRIGTYDDAGGTGWSFYHTNHQGSILFTTRGGALADKYRYDSYGIPASGDSPLGNPIRYTGRYLDAETELYYYRARYYSAKIGRFLQTDPIGPKDDLNLYAYVGNDPTDSVDPAGTEAVGTEWLQQTQALGAASPANSGALADALEGVDNFFTSFGPAGFDEHLATASLILGLRAIGSAAGPGRWVARNEAMSDAARAFQVSQGGRAGQAYLVNGVHFDAYVGGSLIEAKGSYAQFVKNGQFAPWFTGKGDLVAQANRQLGAAGNTPVVWKVADAATRDAINSAFKQTGIKGITVQVAEKHVCTGTHIATTGPC